MPLRNRLACVAALVAAVAVAACATMRPSTNLPPHPVTITVINNVAIPTDMTLYAVTSGGAVRILGSVAPTDSTSLQMTPRDFSEPYRLLVESTLGHRHLWSDEFTFRDANTGEIVWRLVPNILQFYDVAEDSTTAPATP